MHKSFYFFGVFFLALACLAALFMSILFFQIGYRIYYLDAYSTWFWVEVGLSLTTAFIMLNYYRYKAYRLTYIATIITIIASIGMYFTTYLVVVLMMREFMNIQIITNVFFILTILFYATSLMFSRAGKNIWLKTNGVLLFIVGLASGLMMIWNLNWMGWQNQGNVELVQQWLNLFGSLTSIPLIILFYQEHQLSASSQSVEVNFKYKDLLFAILGIIVMAGLVGGFSMGTQTYWSTYISPEEKALVNRFENKTYEGSKGNTLEYLFLKPLNYDSTQKYPLVICLHGGPQSVKTERMLVTQPAPLLSDSSNRAKYPAFLFVPQAPPARSWGGIPYAQAIDTLLISSIRELKKEYAIDEDRIYLTGISMGGYGSWYLLGTRPELFAAAIPMCGAGDTTLAENMADIPIWAFHGSEDKNVPVSGSRNMIAAIKEAGGDPKYTEFPEVAHHVWPHVEKTDGVLDWLFAQERE
ncbi:prolyl oligopeptidase family serine peptidase [Catalinimonas sp. 4WD22]|uniref:carboxylesterase family protein n=1 Tax=Catalinimonas locisalis TaxID=3133978 RepID=UPI003101365B